MHFPLEHSAHQSKHSSPPNQLSIGYSSSSNSYFLLVISEVDLINCLFHTCKYLLHLFAWACSVYAWSLAFHLWQKRDFHLVAYLSLLVLCMLVLAMDEKAKLLQLFHNLTSSTFDPRTLFYLHWKTCVDQCVFEFW